MGFLLPKMIDKNFFQIIRLNIVIGFAIIFIGLITDLIIISLIGIGFFTIVPILFILNELHEHNIKQQNLREEKQ